MKLDIIVVDDETPICEWLVYCIRKASPDYEVHAASNGEDALALALERKPDLVFTDIRMPGMDGLELMSRVLETLPFTTFAILTNYAEFSYAKQAVSLGAREYFLKSELRSADVEKLLDTVVEAKKRFAAVKVEDVLPSGCIDLYGLYQAREEPGSADRFWAKQGMWADKPYAVFCVPNGNTPESWRTMSGLAAELGAGGELYAAAACVKGYLYLLLQGPDDRRLEEELARVTPRLLERTGQNLGLSGRSRSRDEFTELVRQCTRAVESFFFGGGGCARYDTLAARLALSREDLHRRKRALLDLLAQRRYAQAAEELERWFAAYGRVGAEDVEWAVDSCRRMVMSIEECCQESEGVRERMDIQASLAECARRCADLLAEKRRQYEGKCSPSIETALAYLHEHYQEQISMAEVARQVFRAPEYFSRQFKEEVGENFSVYLTLYRLDRAQELLRSTDLRPGEIAERVGYTTPAYFSRLYKKYKGVAPEGERGSNP